MMQIWSERTSRHPGELKEPDSLGPRSLVDLGLKSKER